MMGRMPMRMTPLPSVELSYPAEWLLDIFNSRGDRPQFRPYQQIPTPPVPWSLNWGWHVIAGAIVIGAALIHFL